MHLRSRLPHARIPDALDGPVGVLIAGCGTGWKVAEVGLTCHGARVTGLGVSRANPAYGLFKAREMGLANATFAHGDIMNAAALGTAFDYTQCGGVLHHMADLLAAWKVLVDCLAPDGVMKVALYAKATRGAVAHARAIIIKRKIGPTPDNLCAFRQFVMGRPTGSPLSALTRFTNFYYLNDCRDLLFHEHQIDLGFIKRACEARGLNFFGFHFRDPDMPCGYRRAFAYDAGMTDLDNWALFEREHPTAFESMYQFW
jgi:SAM-dependent methyltransferase